MRRLDRTSLVAGLALIAVGAVLLLDRLGDIQLDVGGTWPLLAFLLGVVLLASGLDERRRP
jgi:hypothetical protein